MITKRNLISLKTVIKNSSTPITKSSREPTLHFTKSIDAGGNIRNAALQPDSWNHVIHIVHDMYLAYDGDAPDSTSQLYVGVFE